MCMLCLKRWRSPSFYKKSHNYLWWCNRNWFAAVKHAVARQALLSRPCDKSILLVCASGKPVGWRRQQARLAIFIIWAWKKQKDFSSNSELVCTAGPLLPICFQCNGRDIHSTCMFSTLYGLAVACPELVKPNIFGWAHDWFHPQKLILVSINSEAKKFIAQQCGQKGTTQTL